MPYAQPTNVNKKREAREEIEVMNTAFELHALTKQARENDRNNVLYGKNEALHRGLKIERSLSETQKLAAARIFSDYRRKVAKICDAISPFESKEEHEDTLVALICEDRLLGYSVSIYSCL